MHCVSWIVLLTVLAPIEPASREIQQLAEECRYSTFSMQRSSWVANPPLSVNETSVSGYSCMEKYVFLRMGPNRRSQREEPNRVQLALREAESTNSSWQYKTVLSYYCEDGCHDLWSSNFSNYLIGSATFTNLKPNTLYTMVTFLCYSRDYEYRPCIVDVARDLSQEVNISTTPLVPVFSVAEGTISVTLHFMPNYHVAGPPPHGHEIVVWPVIEGTAPGPFSHYHELCVLEVAVKHLQPGTKYRLHVRSRSVRADSSNINYGRWTAREVRTLPVEPGEPTITATASRDTAVIVKLTPAQTYGIIDQCLVSVLPTTGSDVGSATGRVVKVTSNVLYIDGLLPGTEYSYQVAAMNEAGRSNFTEWLRFTTTANVHMTASDSSITLRWMTPHIIGKDNITAYKILMSSIQDTTDVVTYTLPGSRQTAMLGGLRPGVTYQVRLMTETSSGLQPFYSANVTTVSGGVSESVTSGIAGAGVMLVIALAVCVVIVMVTVCCILWRMKRSRKQIASMHEGSGTAAAGDHENESPGNNSNYNDVKIDSNPAYVPTEYFGEGGTDLSYHGQADHEVKRNKCGRGRREEREGNGRIDQEKQQVYEEMEI